MSHRIALNLDVFSNTPLYQQLAEELRGFIKTGRLLAGEKLPSIRDLSRQLQISTITVREALERLTQEGYIVARHGSGNYVAGRVSSTTDSQPVIEEEARFTVGSYSGQSSELDESIAWSKEARALTNAFNDTPFHPWWDVEMDYDFRTYQPGLENLQSSRWQVLMSRWSRSGLTRRNKVELPQGNQTLRNYLAKWLNETRGLGCCADDIFIVSGAQQARDLVSGLLVKPGTSVLVEDPGSITDQLAYKAKGAVLTYIKQDEHGIDINSLAPLTSIYAAHLITTANFPTGVSLSLERKLALLEWAERNDVIIVEDAYGAGAYYEETPPPPVFSLARQQGLTEMVFYLGSLSQLLTPSLRLGYLVVPPRFRRACTNACWLAGKYTSAISQELALSFFAEGFFEEHSMRLAQMAHVRRKVLLESLSEWPRDLITYQPVKAGYQQTVYFTKPVDDLLVFEKAIHEHIGVLPISPYYFHHESRSGLTLNFVRMPERKIHEGLRRLLRVVETCVLAGEVLH